MIIPLNNRAHGTTVVALCVAFPLGFGALALVLGQDTNWDLRNYHWYNAYAFLTGRLALDIGPAHAAPYFNEVFRSPMGLPASYRDTRFIPESLWEALAFPVLFRFDPYRVGETPSATFASSRPMSRSWRRAHRSTAPAVEPLGARYVIAAAALSYAAWIPLFSIYRYIVSLEMLAPVLVTAAVGLWRVAPRARVAAVAKPIT